MILLSTGEENFMKIFRHFKSTEGEVILVQSILAVQNDYMSSPNIRDLTNILNSLESKGFVKKGKSNSIILTQIGEEYLYGQFDVKEGSKEFMVMFKNSRSTKGEVILVQSILAVRDKILSPINNKNFEAIINYVVENKYVEKKDDNSFMLTEEGEKYIYYL